MSEWREDACECEACGRALLAGEWLVELLNGPDAPWWVCVECQQQDEDAA